EPRGKPDRALVARPPIPHPADHRDGEQHGEVVPDAEEPPDRPADAQGHDRPGRVPGEPAGPLDPPGAAGNLRLGGGGASGAAHAVLAGSVKGGRHARLLATTSGRLSAWARAPACSITVPPNC